MGVTEISVYPEAWDDAADADRDAYERRAADLGIRLEHQEQPGAASPGEVVLVVDGDVVTETFSAPGPCPARRAPWEHIVRRELGLDDPCL